MKIFQDPESRFFRKCQRKDRKSFFEGIPTLMNVKVTQAKVSPTKLFLTL